MSGAPAYILVICGPAGCGKSSVAKKLAADLNFSYVEGDEYHTKEAVQKMSDCQALTDVDRWDWLIRLRERAAQLIREGTAGVVLSCSALKRKYRDVIRIISLDRDENVIVRFIHLWVQPEVLLERVRARKNHYMQDAMVQSQLDSLELPGVDEWDVITVNANLQFSAVYNSVSDVVGKVVGNNKQLVC